MRNPVSLRRYAGLSMLFIGLVAGSSTLTLAALGKGGWILISAAAGLALAVGGLRMLARGPS